METERICNKCGEINNLDGRTITKKDVVDEDGQHYRLLWYTCKRCREKQFLQIDDDETLEIFHELKRLIVDTQKKRMKKQTVSPKAGKKAKDLNKQLDIKREILMELTEGKKIYDGAGNIITEHLTFFKGGDIIESKL